MKQKPKAQGHAITNTEMPVTKEKTNRSKKVGSKNNDQRFFLEIQLITVLAKTFNILSD